jgi:hypothetical protein
MKESTNHPAPSEADRTAMFCFRAAYWLDMAIKEIDQITVPRDGTHRAAVAALMEAAAGVSQRAVTAGILLSMSQQPQHK